jgi:hypothetical protein
MLAYKLIIHVSFVSLNEIAPIRATWLSGVDVEQRQCGTIIRFAYSL